MADYTLRRVDLECFRALIIFCHTTQSNCATTVLKDNENVATELTNSTAKSPRFV